MPKYHEKLDEYSIADLDNEMLDPAFVVKAKEFETKLAAGSLTDDEIETIDNELCELFASSHDFENVDAPEVTELQAQNTILEGKIAADKAVTTEDLLSVIEKYKAYPEVIEIAQKKVDDIAEAEGKIIEEQAKKDKLIKDVNTATTIEELKEISKDFPVDQPWILEVVNTKAKEINSHKKVVEETKNTEIQTKLLSKSRWTYSELREMGIEPTGDDMVVHGISLLRVYLFFGYEVEGQIDTI